jgi:hypothetical protein
MSSSKSVNAFLIVFDQNGKWLYKNVPVVIGRLVILSVDPKFSMAAMGNLFQKYISLEHLNHLNGKFV